MNDTFKARFDGREWWASGDDQRVGLWHQRDLEPLGSPVLLVPAHMVERIPDLPPEPPVGTVLYDNDDRAWAREDYRAVRPDIEAFWWSPVVKQWLTWREVQQYGPLHPYPKAARDERDARRDERDMASRNYQRELERADELQRRIDRTLRYVENPGNWPNGRPPHIAAWLRGER